MTRLRTVTLLTSISVLIAVPITASSAQARDWVAIRARHGISLRLPSTWIIQDEPANTRQAARANAVVDLTNLPQNSASLLLQADTDSASITVSFIPGHAASQAEVAPLTSERLASIDADFQSDLKQGMDVEGAKLLTYQGTRKEKVGALWSLVARYKYQLPGEPVRSMESHRIFIGSGSIGLMLQSTAGSSEHTQRTLKAIRNSFVVQAGGP